jgi:hypothetical protein
MPNRTLNGSAYETGEREYRCLRIDESLTEHGIDVPALTACHGLGRYETPGKWHDRWCRPYSSPRDRSRPGPRRMAFLLWCSASKLTRPFRLPPVQISRATPMSQTERLELIGRLLTDPSLPLRVRVAGGIVLLYAQPLSRVVPLAGRHHPRPTPDPSPARRAAVPRSRTARGTPVPLDNMNTATNHACRWLFSGRRAGQPLHPDVLAALLNDIGIPTTAGRTAAIRQHVLEMPALVVAEALSYHRVTTARRRHVVGCVTA